MLILLATAQRLEPLGIMEIPAFNLGRGDIIELSRYVAPSFFYGDVELETEADGPHALVKINGLEVFRWPYPADCQLVERRPGIPASMLVRLPDAVTA